MFEAISGKIMASVVSLSMLLFSSFKGNNPSFGNTSINNTGTYLHISTTLVSAFENDFPSIFSSGATIPVHYYLVIKSGNTTVVNRKYTQSVTFYPGKGIYEITRNGIANKIKTTSSAQVAAELSAMECSIPIKVDWGNVTLHWAAELPSVHFEQLDKTVDLMVLWKYKRPETKLQLNLKQIN